MVGGKEQPSCHAREGRKGTASSDSWARGRRDGGMAGSRHRRDPACFDDLSSDPDRVSFAAPRFESVRELLLEMAQERSLDALLRRIVGALSALPDVALARIWLIEPGDICSSCAMREECPQHVSCLHLVASAGTPRGDSGADW